MAHDDIRRGSDDDGDNYPDSHDPYPNNFDGDNDGCQDGFDQALISPGCEDLDGDGISDQEDPDIDNDGATNDQERFSFPGSDPYNPDSDGDGELDSTDFMPHNPRVQSQNQLNASLFSLIELEQTWKDISSLTRTSFYAGVTTSNELYVWGTNYGGLPANDAKSFALWDFGQEYGYSIVEPIRVRPDVQWESVVLGKKFGLGMNTDGELYSWGST